MTAPRDIPLEDLWAARPPSMTATRARNTLLREGHRTAGDAAGKTAGELAGIPGFGPAQLREVRSVLAAAGLAPRGEGQPS